MAGSPPLARLVRLAGRSPACAVLVRGLERVSRFRPGLLPVLAYHRVDDPTRPSGLYPGLVSATPEAFAEQMAFLSVSYHLVSMAELLDARAGRASIPERSVMVTFDDAYRDFAEHAWPAMRRLGVPVTLFVPTGYPDRPDRCFWWDRLFHALHSTARDACDTPGGRLPLTTAAERMRAFRAVREQLKRLPHSEAMDAVEAFACRLEASAPAPAVLGWDELRRLAREGVTLAPHSRTHPLLNRVSLEEAREEVAGSLADLQREIGPTAPAFAYPSGAHDDRVVTVLAEAGFAAGFTVMRWGSNDLRRASWLRLRRILVTRGLTAPLLRAQLLPLSTRLATTNPASRLR